MLIKKGEKKGSKSLRAKHRLPDEENGSLNSAIGSVQESLLNKAFRNNNNNSMATNDQLENLSHSNDENDDSSQNHLNQTITRRSVSKERTTSEHLNNTKSSLNHSIHNQVFLV